MEALSGRLASLTGWHRHLLALLLGVMLGLAQVPFGLWPLAFVAGPLLFLLWTSGDGFRTGWLAGVGFFGLTLHWIVEPFLVDVARHGWMAPFALVLMAGGLALFWGAAFWLAGRLRAGGAPVLALCWAGAEVIRGTVLTGFPWVLPAYIWVDTPVAQLASVVGPYGLSFLTLLAMLCLGAQPRRWLPALVFVAVTAGWIWGDFRQATATGSTGLTVRIVQPNIPQALKWDADHIRRNFDTTLALTAGGDRVPDVVIWPEVATTFEIERADEAQAEIARAAAGAPVILGSLARSPTANRWRNSLLALDPEGRPVARYDKAHLVPFGEYMPLGDLMDSLGLLALAGQGLGIEAGDPPRPLSAAGLPAFVPLICYEGIFPGEVRSGAAGASWIVLITNDAWFGNWAGPAQHLSQARMRAIETGLPVARAANTGISAMIGPYGVLHETLPLNQTGRLDADLPMAAEATIFTRLAGILNLLIAALGILLPLFVAFLTKRDHPLR